MILSADFTAVNLVLFDEAVMGRVLKKIRGNTRKCLFVRPDCGCFSSMQLQYVYTVWSVAEPNEQARLVAYKCEN